MNETVQLILGVVCAAIGGELFVRGAVGLGSWLRIPPGIVGATIAAFATSSPELSVSISSAVAGTPEIALGDALGSNVVNVALILGIALAVSGIQSPRDSIKRDYPVALFVPVVTALLLFDGLLSRLDGLLMIAMFFVWLAAAVIEAKRTRHVNEAGTSNHLHNPWRIGATCVVGLAFLFVAGKLIVAGAQGIAQSFGIGEFVIGATIVAIGTSVPELATTVIAKLRGHDEVGLGTVLGSNIFNGIFVVAMAATIRPISVVWREVAFALIVGILALALAFPNKTGYIGRQRGFLLLLLYVFYVAIILQR